MGVVVSIALVASFAAGAYCVSDEKEELINQTLLRGAVAFAVGYLVGKIK